MKHPDESKERMYRHHDVGEDEIELQRIIGEQLEHFGAAVDHGDCEEGVEKKSLRRKKNRSKFETFG